MPGDHFSADFSDFGGVAYLNAAYHGAMPKVASEAVEDALQWKKTPHLIRDELHFSLPHRYRSAVARLIGAREQDVAIADSATHGIMTVVNGLDWSEGDGVVLPSGEFPANRLPWHSLADRGVHTIEVELGDDEDATDRLMAACTETTRVLAASWVSYATGRKLDIESLGAFCRQRGIVFVIDGSQGVGGLPFDVGRVGCSVVACAGYKWLLGPYGLGFTWIDPELSDHLSSGNVNWMTAKGAEDFSRLTDVGLDFPPGARRFDVNETAAFLNLSAGAASIEYLNEVTVERVEAHVRGLQERLVRGLPPAFRPAVDPGSPRSSNILCLVGDSDATMRAASDALARARVVVSLRERAIRIAPHLYNTPEDIDRLLEALDASTRA